MTEETVPIHPTCGVLTVTDDIKQKPTGPYMLAEATYSAEQTYARTEIVMTPVMTRGMVSRTQRAADEVDPPEPNPPADGKIATSLEDTRRQSRFLAGQNKQYPNRLSLMIQDHLMPLKYSTMGHGLTRNL